MNEAPASTTVFDVIVRMLSAFATIDRNIMYIAWSSQFAESPKFSVAADIVAEIAKSEYHAIVSCDMGGHSLIFEKYNKGKLAKICSDGTIMAGDTKLGEWFKNPDTLPAPRDIPYKRASFLVAHAKKSAVKRPTVLVFFRGTEELGDVSKFVVESFRSMSSTLTCLAVIVSVNDNGSVVVSLNGKIATAI